VPEVGSGFIGFDDAVVVGIGDEGVAVREPACEGDSAEGYAADGAGVLCVTSIARLLFSSAIRT
jgi:hypothetical protein